VFQVELGGCDDQGVRHGAAPDLGSMAAVEKILRQEPLHRVAQERRIEPTWRECLPRAEPHMRGDAASLARQADRHPMRTRRFFHIQRLAKSGCQGGPYAGTRSLRNVIENGSRGRGGGTGLRDDAAGRSDHTLA